MIAARPLPRDPELPELAWLLPAEGPPPAGVEMARALASAELDPRRGEIRYVRYRPTRSCVVLWSFPTSARPVWIYARHAVPERARSAGRQERFDALAKRIEAERGIRPWQLHANGRVRLHAFPLDPRLPALADANSPDWARRSLTPLADGSGGTPRVEALSYKPERRCVFRYEMGAGEATAIRYAKAFRDGRGAGLLSMQRALQDWLGRTHAPFEVVAPQHYLPDRQILVFEAVPGVKATRVLEAVADGGEPVERLTLLAGQAARGLEHLQRASLDGLPGQPPRSLVARFRRDAERVEAVAPELARSLAGVLARLDDAAGRLESEALVPSHGAFRLGQLLARENTTVVLDFDTLGRSGASADAGNFVAYLEVAALRRPRLLPALEKCRDAFLAALPHPDSPWLAWYRTLSLVKIALRTFLSLEPDWPERMERLQSVIGEASAGFAVGTRSRC
jgi:hypothetical protein